MNIHSSSFTAPATTGTIGGTLTIFLANIHSADMVKTIVLSAIGSIVSFGISMLMKKLLRTSKKSRN